MSAFEIVDSEKAEYPVSLVCETVGVSRSGYYAWKRAEPSERDKQNERLLVEIRALHVHHRERYGSPRIHQELQEAGHTVNRKRVARLMRENALRGTSPLMVRIEFGWAI